MRAAGPYFDDQPGGLAGFYGLDAAVGVERPLGPAACLIESAVRTPKPSLCRTIAGVAVEAVERHRRARGIMLANHDEHVQVRSLVGADPDRQGHAAGDLGVF